MAVLVNANTRVMTQGITGKTGQFHTRMCRDYANGQNCFVAGVNPKKAGEDFEGIPIYATVREAKQVLTGNGNASKEQVAKMLQSLLNLKTLPKNLDATDGLAAAVCHFYNAGKVEIGKSYTGWSAFVKQNESRVKK